MTIIAAMNKQDRNQQRRSQSNFALKSAGA
jgi:hypothetical protein